MDIPGDVLADALQAINDPQARSRNLTALVQTLSPWERRHVRLELGDRDGLSGFEDLPADLVCLLIRYLHIEDVLACAAVSTRCRAIWTEPSVAARLCLRFFPVLNPPFTYSAFHEAGRNYFRRRAGKFTSRLDMSIPSAVNDLLPGEKPPQSLPDWDSDSRKVFRPDPALHPDGSYPGDWLDMLNVEFMCYGGGNIVWLACPDFFVVDNMYTRTRKVIRFPGRLTVANEAAASKSLVVLHNWNENKLFVYNIETDTTSHFQLLAHLESMIVRDSRVFVVMSGLLVCVLDHNGSRILTKHHFKAGDGLKEECPDFTPRGTVLVFSHPHIPDRFFVAISGWANMKPPFDIGNCSDGSGAKKDSIKYTVIREFNGASYIASYRYSWASYARGNEDMDLATVTEAADDQGSYSMGAWVVNGTDKDDMDAMGLPPLPKGFTHYKLQTAFNTVTKGFETYRLAVPTHYLPRRCGSLWNGQYFVPHVQRQGVLQIRRFDPDAGDFLPTQVSRPKMEGERETSDGWTVEVQGIEEYVEECMFFHDADFTVMVPDNMRRIYVWSFVEDEHETEISAV